MLRPTQPAGEPAVGEPTTAGPDQPSGALATSTVERGEPSPGSGRPGSNTGRRWFGGTRRPGSGTRRRRWARRIGVAVLTGWLAVTAFSFVYNAATARRATVPAGLTYVRTGDIVTRYREWGSHGTPVVLVHGAIETADTWDPVGRLLAADHRVYAFDLNGAGYTRGAAPYDIAHQGSQLLAFLAAEHLDRPVLVAHSAGAAAAADAVLRAPGRVSGLMFLDGDGLAITGTGTHAVVGAIRTLLVRPYRTTLMRLAVRSDALIRSVYARQCGPSCPRLDAAGVQMWRRPLQVAGAESALWAEMRPDAIGLPASRIAQLRAVDIPKAVVFGSDDTDGFDADAPTQTAARIGAPAPTLIPGAHHLTMISSPGAVAAAVESLVARS